MTGGTDAVLQNGTVYSYNLAGNYAANGNLLGYTDSLMGTWAFGYDNMNRLLTGASSSGAFAGDADCFSYDSFGNRLSGTFSANPCPAAPLSIPSPANNRISGLGYSASGNVTGGDGNYYLYDSENRVCAIQGAYGGGLTGYIYDAEGARVAKGTLSGFACPNGSNFTPTTEFLLGQGGEQVTELTVSGTSVNWDHSNVYASGKLLATYDSAGVHFQLSDWLGSKRVQTNAAGLQDETCTSLAFGDNLNCSGTDPSHLHFTGKERDNESGLDYFGARYYASNMGRWMSPDWAKTPQGVPYAVLSNPQSLNLYGYVLNNPLSKADKDGHCPDPQQCSEVKVAVTAPPPAVTTTPSASGPVTGVGTVATVTITDKNNAPISGMKVTEDPKTTNNLTGNPVSSPGNSGTTNPQGQIKDSVVAPMTKDTPTAAVKADVALSSTEQAYSHTTQQTLSFTTPTGCSCQATYSETLSNVNSSGTLNPVNSQGLNMNFTFTTPVVTPVVSSSQ